MTALEQAAVNLMRIIGSGTAPQGTKDSDEWPYAITCTDEESARLLAEALQTVDTEIKKLKISPR